MDEIIIKYLCGESTPEDRAVLNSWRADSADNEEMFRQVEKTWQTTGRIKGLTSHDIDYEWNYFLNVVSEKSKARRTNKYGITYWRVAASLLLISLVAYLLVHYSHTERYKTNAVSQEFVLEDGSDIALNAFSEIRVNEDFGDKDRRIFLKGEAFFDVARNEQKPFVIETEYGSVSVLGTSFNVFEDHALERTIVTVRSGKVKVENKQSGQIKVLTKGMSACISSNGALQVNNQASTNYLAWKTKEMNFENVQLKEIASVLRSVYHQEIAIENKNLENCTLTAAFDNASLEEVLEVIASTLEINYKKEDHKVVFSGEGC